MPLQPEKNTSTETQQQQSYSSLIGPAEAAIELKQYQPYLSSSSTPPVEVGMTQEPKQYESFPPSFLTGPCDLETSIDTLKGSGKI